MLLCLSSFQLSGFKRKWDTIDALDSSGMRADGEDLRAMSMIKPRKVCYRTLSVDVVFVSLPTMSSFVWWFGIEKCFWFCLCFVSGLVCALYGGKSSAKKAKRQWWWNRWTLQWPHRWSLVGPMGIVKGEREREKENIKEYYGNKSVLVCIPSLFCDAAVIKLLIDCTLYIEWSERQRM